MSGQKTPNQIAKRLIGASGGLIKKLGPTGRKSIAGRLIRISNGLIQGQIDGPVGASTSVTIEVLAHGIALKRHGLKLTSGKGPVPFEFPIEGFPQVNLPCALRGRIVETDTLLSGEIELRRLDDVWTHLMPYRIEIERIDPTRIFLRLKGPRPRQLPVLDLRSWGLPVAQSVPDGTPAEDEATLGIRLRIDVPVALSDGADHRLGIFHAESGLPVVAGPIMQDAGHLARPGQAVSALESRITALEKALKMQQATAFQAVVDPLYRHIDQMLHLQRTNFEAEIGALRKLLGVSNAEAAATPAPLSKIMLEMDAPITGYGLHAAEISSTGKPFRWLEPACGLFLPGLSTKAPLHLHIQGLRRMHADSLHDVELYVNGNGLDGKLYLNPKSESWNLQASLPAAALRNDRNLVELRIPHGPLGGGREADADKAVGLMFIEIAPPAAAA